MLEGRAWAGFQNPAVQKVALNQGNAQIFKTLPFAAGFHASATMFDAQVPAHCRWLTDDGLPSRIGIDIADQVQVQFIRSGRISTRWFRPA